MRSIRHLLSRITAPLLLAAATAFGPAVAQPAAPAKAPAAAASAAVDTPRKPGVLRVAVKPAKPFAYEENGQWKGYSVELWNAIAQQEQWQFEWVPMDTVPQTLEALQKGQVDVGVGALSITEEREKVLDFSHPFFESGLQIMSPVASAGSIWVALQGLASAPVLGGFGALVLALLLVSWLLWWFEHKDNEESFPAPAWIGFKESLWWSTNILIAGGCENKSPNGTPGRLLAVVWMLGGIAFTSYITAVFTSTLTVTRLNTQVRGMADLQGQIVGTVEGSSSDAYLNKLGGIPVEGHDSVDSAMAALLKKDVKAVVYDAPMLRYWMSTHPAENEKVALAGDTFARQHYGFALPVGSAKRKEINETLLQLRGSGFLEDLEKRWFGSIQAPLSQ
ncbi:transporter substrate-binding domain-containing protein [Aquabacterium soli]|uniref:Transporter substrate-binding domain-containing protein n=1 Tax=Aquabacterium soli TaxID=2493092 RepID=A0A3R8S5Q1_9BURK|nr:transporter substrate-binding domain-containing protein [Aquabacterium soli]RRS06153.1 transporter substrate-binding domain-containing protein [Aquabacterium soli]